MKKLIAIAFVLGIGTAGAVEITSVTARQRWPWNNLVDVDFNLTAPAGETYRVELEAKCAGDTKHFAAKTLVTDPTVMAGENRVTWDFGADYPGVRAEDMRFSVSVVPTAEADKPLYMVIDLSGGTGATKYPVRYTSIGPEHVQGAKDEPCQTTELWLRRITAPKTAFCVMYFRTANYGGDAFYAKLTKDYYIGVFELTQKQYNLIAGTWPSWFTNAEYRDSRPVEQLPFNTMTGTWEDTSANPNLISGDSPLGKLRAKTGLPLNLPTLAQLQYAALGGSPLGRELYQYYVDGAQAALNDIARYKGNVEIEVKKTTHDADGASGTAVVGSYLPNGYGLYDMLGNAWEISATPKYNGNWNAYYQTKAGESTLGTTAGNPVVDPKGCAASEASTQSTRAIFGGSWSFDSNPSVWLFRSKKSAANWENYDMGYRLTMTVE